MDAEARIRIRLTELASRHSAPLLDGGVEVWPIGWKQKKPRRKETHNMSALYGTIEGAKGKATRCGHRELITHSACWNGAVRVELQHDKETNSTSYLVQLVPWHGTGENKVLAEGVMENQK